MLKIVLFWVLLGGLGFASALAIQMRMMIALVLRRALMARESALSREEANAAVIAAAAEQNLERAADQRALHLRETYPNPLRHLRRARRASIIAPVLLLVILLIGRFGLGVI